MLAVDAAVVIVSGDGDLGDVRVDEALAADAPRRATAVLSPPGFSSVTTSEESEEELGRVSSLRFVQAESNNATGTRTLKRMRTLINEAEIR